MQYFVIVKHGMNAFWFVTLQCDIRVHIYFTSKLTISGGTGTVILLVLLINLIPIHFAMLDSSERLSNLELNSVLSNKQRGFFLKQFNAVFT